MADDVTKTVAAATWAVYLQDDVIGLRPVVEADADYPLRWDEHSFPLTKTQTLERLKGTESAASSWGGGSTLRLIAVRRDDSEIMGGIRIDRDGHRVRQLRVTPARALPDAERHEVTARALGIVLPWLLDEVGVLSIVMHVADDEEELAALLADHGFRRVGTWREHVRRVDRYIDQHLYQLINPKWVIPKRDVEEAHAHA